MQQRSVDLIVHGGLVVTPSGAFEGAVAIKGERIVAVGAQEALPPAERYIDAGGKHVLPGAIDCHVHFGPVDDWSVGPVAAAHAGLTTIIPFHLFEGERQEMGVALRKLREEADSLTVVDYAVHLILSNHPKSLEGLPEAFAAGVTSFKMFMTYKKRLTRYVTDSQVLRAMEVVAAHNGLVQLHCENGEAIDYFEDRAVAEGRVLPTDFPATCPPWAEEEAVNRAITLGAATCCPVYVVHLSTRGGLERIKRAQAEGQRVWTETCPQYLLLDETAMARFGPYIKIGPPLRGADGGHQAALWAGLARGDVSAIGSDHSVYPREQKDLGWKNIFVMPDGAPVPFGAPSMETLVPLVYSEGVARRGLPLTWMARVLSENPARIFGLYPRKGAIQAGSDADLLIIDPAAEWTVRAADLHGRSGFTPYEGWTVHGRPWMTVLRGQVLLDRGRLDQRAGYGRFLPAGVPLPPLAGFSH